MKKWSVRAVALLTALMGLTNVLSATTPALADRVAILRTYLPLEVRFGSHLAAALSGFALLLLAQHLWRRKRVAWLLTVVVLSVSSVSHLLKGLDYEEALLSLSLALWLASLKSNFHARSDRPSIRHSLSVLLAALAFSLLYGILGLALLDHHFSIRFNFWQAAQQVVILFTQFTNPGVIPVTRFGDYFVDSIYLVAATTLGYSLLALVRPVLVRGSVSAAERVHARGIVEAYGKTSLAWFALSNDKSYYFSPGGSVVAYVVSGRICLAAGDVIGPAQDTQAALAGFHDFCAANDWLPAFLCTEPDTLAHYEAGGFATLCIGHEAIIPLEEFTLAGGRHKDIRGRVNRLKKLGSAARLHEPPLSNSLLDELRMVSDEWLSFTHTREAGFSLGAFEEDELRHSPVMAVHGPDGGVAAFANLYPEYQRNEATIDLMRRRRDVENGTMEFLFVSLFEWAKERGYDTFNLGLSPLAGVGHETGDPATERALRFLFERNQPFYNFKGLYGFKSKFHPHWSPRYLIYPGPASLGAVISAVIRTMVGDDFFWQYLRVGWAARRSQQRADLTPPQAATLSLERRG